jgi:3',5'-cyclic AMP phosphodiesterase CpdA
MEYGMRRSAFIAVAGALFTLHCVLGAAQNLPKSNVDVPRIELPNSKSAVRFAVIGDAGTGGNRQRQLAEVMARSREAFPFEFVLMTGDNIYGEEDAKDYVNKFERPYQALLSAGVKFYASLGNHDNSNQRFYKNFNMDGREYYSFKKGNIRFFALNSNYMDGRQLEWVEKELSGSDEEWKICFFHHPPYSSGERHGSDDELRKVLEPVFVRYKVNVVFTGHEHFYERIKPQKGIYYFISGAGGKLREGNVKPTELTAKSFDRDLHFMLVEVAGDEMHFQTISRVGRTVDSGVIPRLSSEQGKDSGK